MAEAARSLASVDVGDDVVSRIAVDRERALGAAEDDLRGVAATRRAVRGAVRASLPHAARSRPARVVLLARTATRFDDVHASLKAAGDPFVFDGSVAVADRLDLFSAARTSTLAVGDLVLDDRRRQRCERLGVVLSLLGIRVAAAGRLVSLLLLCFVFGGRHALGLRPDDLLGRERKLVLHLIDTRGQCGELRISLGELLFELRRLAPPPTVMSLRRQCSSLIMSALACPSIRASDRSDPA